MTTKALAYTMLLAAVVVPLTAIPSHATEADGLDEIVVAAQRARGAGRLDVPLDDLPLNVAELDTRLVEDLQLLSQRDALQFHAAVDDKRVRGFNTSEFFRNGFVHLSDMPGYTIERVEIVRGPTATLNGPVTPGGAINVISRRALTGNSSFSAGTFWGRSGDDRDNRGANLDLNFGRLGAGPDGEPRAAFRFVGGWQGDTGFGTRVDNESHALLPSLQIRPGEDTVIDLEYYRYEINTDRTDRAMAQELFIPGATPGTEIPLAIAYGVDDRTSWFGETTDIEESLGDWTATLSHRFGERLTLNVAWNRHARDFGFAPGNRPRIDLFYVMTPTASAPMGSTNPAEFRLRRLTEQLLLENQIDQLSLNLSLLPGGSGNDRHRLLIGADSYDQDQSLLIERPRAAGATAGFLFEFFNPATVATDNLRFNASGSAINWIPVVRQDQAIKQRNAYLNYHGRYANDRLRLLLGVSRSEVTIDRTNLLVTTPASARIADSSRTLWQAGAIFDLSDAVALYANFSQSQLPDLNDPDFARAPPIRFGEQYEIGTRVELADGTLQLNVGLFSIDEELRGETFRDAEVRGADLDLTYTPVDHWTSVLSYAFADTETLRSFIPANIGAPLVDEVPHKAAFWTRYEIPSGAARGLAFGAGFSWTGERVRAIAAAADAVKRLNGRVLRFEPETRLDAFATYTFGTASELDYVVSLNVRNLTREANLSNVVPRVPLQGGVKADGSPYVFDGDIEVMLGLEVKF